MTGDDDTIIVAEDEQSLLDLYTAWLRETYTVHTATSGETVLDLLDDLDDDVDAILLDRRMPGLSGEEALDAIRERDATHHVALVTAVEPDLDVVDLEFDDYLVKPTEREELEATVETLVALSDYDSQFLEYFRLTRKLACLESSVPPSDLESSDRIDDLRDAVADLESALDDIVDDVGDDPFSHLANTPREDRP